MYMCLDRALALQEVPMFTELAETEKVTDLRTGSDMLHCSRR